MTATPQQIIRSSQWHHLSIEEVTRHLDTNLETGLTSTAAAKKREHFGANELKSKPTTSPLLRFIQQFNSHLAPRKIDVILLLSKKAKFLI